MPLRLTSSARRRAAAAPARRPHRPGPVERSAPDAGPAPAPTPSAAQELPAERRYHRAAGSEDAATYSCSCGMVFEAGVTTTVACPLCGTAQAW